MVDVLYQRGFNYEACYVFPFMHDGIVVFGLGICDNIATGCSCKGFAVPDPAFKSG